MPEKRIVDKAKNDLREGKSPSTAAGEFVREEIDHVRQGKHGARSAKQAIAIGLNEARRAGVPLKPPSPGKASTAVRNKAEHDYEKGQHQPHRGERGHSESSTPRGRARSESRSRALKREPKNTTSRAALSRQAKSAARRNRAVQ
jgi:Family of unknown function (DUF6496)